MGMIGYAVPVDPEMCDAIDSGHREVDDAVPSYDDADTHGVCVEKLWHAMHFVLSDGCVWESDGKLGELWMGGRVGVEDRGYGPARYHGPAQVAGFARLLAALPNEALRGRFDPKLLGDSDVYPNIWDEGAEELWDELVAYLDPVRTLIRETAERGGGIVVWIC